MTKYKANKKPQIDIIFIGNGLAFLGPNARGNGQTLSIQKK
jgi:hypothetical protein